MGKIFPFAELGLEQLRAIEDAVKEKLLEVAMRETGKKREELVIRDILPKTDLGLTNEVWVASISTANSWNTWITKELPKNKFIAFYGVAVLSASPITTGVAFKIGATGATTKDIMMYEEIFAEEKPVGYTEEPIIYKGGDYVYIQLYGKSTGTEYIVLKGMICEPVGETISPAITP